MSNLTRWASYLAPAMAMTNVTLVTGDGASKASHALLLAAASKQLHSLLLLVPDTREQVILLPDWSMDQLEKWLEGVLGRRGGRPGVGEGGGEADVELEGGLGASGIEVSYPTIVDWSSDISKDGTIVEEMKNKVEESTYQFNKVVENVNSNEDLKKMNKCKDIKTEVKLITEIDHQSLKQRSNFKCKYCDNIYNQRKNLMMHKKENHINEVADDKIMKEASENRNDLTIPKFDSQGRRKRSRFKCNICKTIFSLKKDLMAHMINDHHNYNHNHATNYRKTNWFRYAEEQGDQYRCKICTKYVTKEGSGLNPKPSWKNIREHICNTHKIGSSIKCPDCEKTFQRQCDVKKHALKHLGKHEIHVCTHCGHAFRQGSYLKIHEVKYHGTEEEKTKMFRFICSICDQKFSAKCLLLEHKKAHGEKTLLCTQCDMKFTTRTCLNSHFKNMHSDTKKTKTEEEKSKFRDYCNIRRARERAENGGKVTEKEKKWNRDSARRRRERFQREREEVRVKD